jgi:hypothetical protein
LLSHTTEEAARRRADQIRVAMVKGQANRLAITNGQWQDICIAREIVRSCSTGDSLASAIRDWSTCSGMLISSGASLLDAVKFYLSHH